MALQWVTERVSVNIEKLQLLIIHTMLYASINEMKVDSYRKIVLWILQSSSGYRPEVCDIFKVALERRKELY